MEKRTAEIVNVSKRVLGLAMISLLVLVSFWSNRIEQWVEIIMIVDTGADYTLLPRFYSFDLGVDLKKDCIPYSTTGVGGTEKVYIFKKAKVKLDRWKKIVPIGFLNRDNIPPLLGRQDFLETFKVSFYRHMTYFAFKK